MTVIAYKDGLLAADSIALVGNRLIPSEKLIKGATRWYATAGNSKPALRFITDLEAGKTPTLDDDKCTVVYLDKTGCYQFEDHDLAFILPSPWSIGSGAELALGALLAGADAIEACRIAVNHLADCNGPIHYVRFTSDKYLIA